MSDSDLDALIALLHENNCMERAHQMAKKYTNQALVAIDALPDHPKKDVLYSLTNQLLIREV